MRLTFGASFALAFGFWLLLKGCFFSPPDLKGWRCRQQSDCLGPLICLQDRCRSLCAGDGECKGGETCVQGGCVASEGDGGSTDTVCQPTAEVCDGKDNDCDGKIDETCLQEGQQCEISDPSKKRLCAGYLRCIHFDATKPRVCMQPCKDSQDCKAESFLCLPVNGFGVCRQTRCAMSGCLWPDHECLSAGGDSRICQPKDIQAEGSQAGASFCSPSEASFCAKGFACFRSASGFQGICSKRCSDKAECEAIDPAMSCLTFPLYPASKVCSYPCGNPVSCAQAFTCSDQVCVAR